LLRSISIDICNVRVKFWFIIICLNVTPKNLNSPSVFITIQIKRKIVYFYKVSFIFILLSVLSYAASDYPSHFQTFLRNGQHFNQNIIQIKRGYKGKYLDRLDKLPGHWFQRSIVRRVDGENHRPAASHRQTLSHNVASSTPRLIGVRTHNVSDDRHWELTKIFRNQYFTMENIRWYNLRKLLWFINLCWKQKMANLTFSGTMCFLVFGSILSIKCWGPKFVCCQWLPTFQNW
jgi:hypothetical protein